MKVERKTAHTVAPLNGSEEEEWVELTIWDVIMPRIYTELFYAFDKAAAVEMADVEQGLHRALSVFPEWTGRLALSPRTGSPAIYVPAQGAGTGTVLIHAFADRPFADFALLDQPSDLLPLIPPHADALELLLVQFTEFTCGGFALGVAYNHWVADGQSHADFMDVWSLAMRGLPPATTFPAHSHNRSAIIPNPYRPPEYLFDKLDFKRGLPTQYVPEWTVGKLHFNADQLQKIKARANKDGATVTTFESLAAHMWRCITKARGLHEGDTMALVAVNARKRLHLKDYFGNAVVLAFAKTTVQKIAQEHLSSTTYLVHDAISRVDNDYIRSYIDNAYIDNAYSIPRSFLPNVVFTNWLHTVPLYKLDFGRGTPAFAGVPTAFLEGCVVFTDAKDGGVDVVTCLFASHLEVLKSIYLDADDPPTYG